MRFNSQSLISSRRFAGLTFALLAAVGIAVQLSAQGATATSKLAVRVIGAKNSRGQIAFALFNGEAGFPQDKSKAVRTVRVPIDPKTLSAQTTLNDLAPGIYAVSVFHDENMNGQLDKNMFGISKEGYGASNNPKKSMGPPKFADAKFQLDQREQTIEIRLIY
jgi:uncharacterized protein (DUF2141 family)